MLLYYNKATTTNDSKTSLLDLFDVFVYLKATAKAAAILSFRVKCGILMTLFG